MNIITFKPKKSKCWENTTAEKLQAFLENKYPNIYTEICESYKEADDSPSILIVSSVSDSVCITALENTDCIAVIINTAKTDGQFIVNAGYDVPLCTGCKQISNFLVSSY